jgi:hypothetical protein
MPGEPHSYLNGAPISAHHFVSFYQDPAYPIATVCDYLAEGLDAGESAIALVTPEHAESIVDELKARGLPVGEMTKDGRLAFADVNPTLVYLLDTKIPKTEKDALMVKWIEDALKRAPAKRCRILGELVSRMVAQGQIDSAIELEETWNHLLAIFPAMLYCVYEQTPFENSPALHKFCDICNRHDGVVAVQLLSDTERQPSAWFVLLQEQAGTLREEVMRRRRAERLVYVNEANRLTQLEALLRVHGPNLTPVEKNDIVKVVSDLQTQARKDKRHSVPESPEWHKKSGEILGYEKVITTVLRTGRKKNGDPDVA